MTDHERTAIAGALRCKMSSLSERAYCAGWSHGIEFHLWRLTQKGGGVYGMEQIGPGEAQDFLALAELCGVWWAWSENALDEVPVPLVEWRKVYAAWAVEMEPKLAAWEAEREAKPDETE